MEKEADELVQPVYEPIRVLWVEQLVERTTLSSRRR